jgi:hypothetical protein
MWENIHTVKHNYNILVCRGKDIVLSIAANELLGIYTGPQIMSFNHVIFPQVATVLANMSGVETCTSDITDNHGIELLVHLLHDLPCDARTEAELAACERVKKKCAIAITRLCKHKDIANTVVDLQGTLSSPSLIL